MKKKEKDWKSSYEFGLEKFLELLDDAEDLLSYLESTDHQEVKVAVLSSRKLDRLALASDRTTEAVRDSVAILGSHEVLSENANKCKAYSNIVGMSIYTSNETYFRVMDEISKYSSPQQGSQSDQ